MVEAEEHAVHQHLFELLARAQRIVGKDGLETESEAIELYHMGCDYAQGFVFGEPMSSLQARRLVGAAPQAA